MSCSCMTEEMGIEYLPFEILEIIVSYLSAKDLARCLGVCRTWYNIFSNDIFWKKHCTANVSDYLSRTKCLVDPVFKPPIETPLPLGESKLRFLREQHLWQNWNKGRFKKEEIEFDCDDSISYNIKVSFLGNDHVCLHRTFETEVWNVAETPSLIMNIPYCLTELWEVNVYKVIENNLVVIQCNVVQIYEISLDSKSWCLKNVFFYNKPEEFSSRITSGTDIDDLFQLEGISEETDFERVICGQYLVGAYMGEESPSLYIWDIRTGKKIKEDKCESCSGNYSIGLKVSRGFSLHVLVTFIFKNSNGRGNVERCSSIIYDLSQMQFVMSTQQDHSGDVMYFDGCLSVVDDNPIKILHHTTGSSRDEEKFGATCLPDPIRLITSIQPLGSNLVFSTGSQLFLINTSENVVKSLERLMMLSVNFKLSYVEILFDKYILLHDVSYQSVKELWTVGDSGLQRVCIFQNDSGTFVASNNACTKIVLERGNKLIVLNFW